MHCDFGTFLGSRINVSLEKFDKVGFGKLLNLFDISVNCKILATVNENIGSKHTKLKVESLRGDMLPKSPGLVTEILELLEATVDQSNPE